MSPLSLAVELAWQIASGEAAHSQQQFIEPAHLFIGICKVGNLAEPGRAQVQVPAPSQAQFLKGEAKAIAELFTRFTLDRVALYREMRKRKGFGNFQHQEKVIHRSPESRQVFARADVLAQTAQSAVVNTRHLLVALLEESSGEVATLLREKGVDLESFKNEALKMTEPPVEARDAPAGHPPAAGGAPGAKAGTPVSTPFLQRYSVDLVQQAQEGKIQPPIGDKIRREMLQVVRLLAQATKNNPVLVGEPGVGKTAVVEGLAWRIAQGKVPAVLQGKRIRQVHMADLVAGTKYQGEFEQRLQGILREASQSPEIILFIDEIHTVVGAGSAGDALDAANILKPALARGEVRCIGATTLTD